MCYVRSFDLILSNFLFHISFVYKRCNAFFTLRRHNSTYYVIFCWFRLFLLFCQSNLRFHRFVSSMILFSKKFFFTSFSLSHDRKILNECLLYVTRPITITRLLLVHMPQKPITSNKCEKYTCTKTIAQRKQNENIWMSNWVCYKNEGWMVKYTQQKVNWTEYRRETKERKPRWYMYSAHCTLHTQNQFQWNGNMFK